MIGGLRLPLIRPTTSLPIVASCGLVVDLPERRGNRTLVCVLESCVRSGSTMPGKDDSDSAYGPQQTSVGHSPNIRLVNISKNFDPIGAFNRGSTLMLSSAR